MPTPDLHPATSRASGRFSSIATSCSAILLVALAIRAAYMLFRVYWAGSLDQDIANTVGNETWNIAQSLLSGKGFSSPFGVETGPSAWVAPVHPYILTGILALFGSVGHGWFLAAAALNELFSALTVVPVFFIGKIIGGRRLGASAAWLWAILPFSIQIGYEWIWYTSLSTLLVACTLWVTLILCKSERIRSWAGYGTLWGLGALTNPTALSLAPFLFGWLIVQRRAAGRSVRMPILAFGVMAAVCTPWTVRNYLVFHEIVPIRSNFGFELWLGNHGSEVDHEDEADLLKRVTEAEYGKIRGERVLRYLRNNPRIAASLTWERFVQTWIGPQHSTSESAPERSWPSRLKWLLYSGFSVMALAGLAFLFKERSPLRWPVAFHPIFFPIVYYLTGTTMHYRLPIDPVIAVMAALGMERCLRLQPFRMFSLPTHSPIMDSPKTQP